MSSVSNPRLWRSSSSLKRLSTCALVNFGLAAPPVLAAAVSGTRELWGGHPIASSLRLLAAYAVALLAASLLLYDHLWED